VSVKNPDGTRSNQLPLVVTEAPAPVVSEVRPVNSCSSSAFELLGANFTTDTIVELENQVATFAIRSNTTIWVGSAAGGPGFKVIVPAPGGGEASGLTPSPVECD